MQRFKIVHRTYYNFSSPVTLGAHQLRLRPREDHEMRIESFNLKITPPATLLWHRDVEGNSVATATFSSTAAQLAIASEVVIQQFNEAPLDFMVAGHAVHYPFTYRADEIYLLLPYMAFPDDQTRKQINDWIANFWRTGEPIQTYSLLQRLAGSIHQTMQYQRREEPGVQAPVRTLANGSGSCRDFATLFMTAARCLGLASRFVSGYLYIPQPTSDYGATHAWAEVYLPGAGWKGFDPTIGKIVGADHIAVAVANLPDAVPPIAGTFTGKPGSSMDVGVWVTQL